MACLIAILALSLCCLTAAQTVCTPGYYDAGAAGCKKCPLGTYQPKKGKKGCIPCPDGYVSMDQGSIKCVKCDKPNQEPSQFKDSCQCVAGAAPDRRGNCNVCKPGQYLFTKPNGTGEVCRKCSMYEFQPKPGQTKCIYCEDGKFANKDRTACIKCPEGEQEIDGVCSTCPPGKALELSTCASCNDAFYVCYDCQEGYFKATKGLEECSPCPPNSFSMRAAKKCVACPEGQAPINPNGKCGICPKGTYYDQSAFRCVKCDPGSFQPYENLRNYCFDCAGDTNSPKGATMCKKCPTGEVLMKDGTCGVCSAGTGYTGYSLMCTKCAVNTYNDGSGNTCLRCPRFSYSLPGATKCDFSCPAGQVLVLKKKKKSKCEGCPLGTYYNNFDGKCEPCTYSGEKYVSPGGDADECRYCDGGSIPNADKSSCIRPVK